MIKIKDTKGGLEIHKVAPVFTQLGLEDGLNIDDLVREFFTVYLSLSNVFLNFSEFYIMLDLIIWRSTNMSNTVYIRPWTITTLIIDYLNAVDGVTFRPFFTNSGGLLNSNYVWSQKQTKRFNFSLYAANQFSWTPEWGYGWNFKKFKIGSWTFQGSFLSYLKRFEMLGRRINFRRKILKKKFEEYS